MSCAAILLFVHLVVFLSFFLGSKRWSFGLFFFQDIEQYAGTVLVRYTQVCGEFFLTPLSDSLYGML